jgi:hypothetical protein
MDFETSERVVVQQYSNGASLIEADVMIPGEGWVCLYWVEYKGERVSDYGFLRDAQTFAENWGEILEGRSEAYEADW